MLSYLRQHKSHLNRLIRLSVPLIAGQLGLVFMGFFDNLMVGQLGHVYLAAAGVANSVYFVVSIIGIGILMVVSTLVSILLGNNEKDQIPSLLRSAMFLSLLITLVLGAILWFLGAHFKWFRQPEEVAMLAEPYLKILIFAQLPMYMYLGLKGISDGYELTRISMLVTFLALLLNIFLNWLLIYGNWGFPKLELQGAGYATLLSRIFMALAMLYFISRSSKIGIPWSSLFRYRRSQDLRQMKEILRLGVPSGFQFFFEVAAFALAAVMAGWINAESLAAHQAAISLASVTYMFATGIASGASITVGNALGQNDFKTIRIYGNLSLGIIFTCMFAFGLIFIAFRSYLVGLFVIEPEVFDIAVQLMILAAAFQVFDGVQAVNLGILRGIRDVKIPLWVAIFAYWVIAIPLGYFIGIYLKYGIFGIWIGLTSGLVITASVLTLRFYARLRQLH